MSPHAPAGPRPLAARPFPTEVLLQAHSLVAESVALRTALRSARHRSLEVLRKQPRPIHGASEPEWTDLREQVREWLASGLLPAPGHELWAGVGSGRLCSICTRTIEEVEVEYEVVGDNGHLYVHRPCFAVWQDEARALRNGSIADGGHEAG